MIILRLAASLAALVWGGALCARRKQPLFFKILLFAAASYFLGALFEGCWLLVYGAVPEGFHVGYLGCVGMWFFLFSSYFGAIDRLADGGERMYRPYRLTALLAPLAVLGLTIWSVTLWGAAASLPCSAGHPHGRNAVLRAEAPAAAGCGNGHHPRHAPYNALVLLLGLCQIVTLMPGVSGTATLASTLLTSLLVVAMLPTAERGVQKWYM